MAAMAQCATAIRKPSDVTKVSVEVLDLDHHTPLGIALRNILSTDLSEFTFAQLLDGLPLIDTAFDTRGCFITSGHPLLDHESLCGDALSQAKAFRDAFDPAVLHFASTVMQAFQNAEPGSREFKMRLIELCASAIHQIGVFLYDLQPKVHSFDEIEAFTFWEPAPSPERLDEETGRRLQPLYSTRIPPYPTFFYHISYRDHDQYHSGLADVAGYWTEDRILGGIAVFDRGISQSECKDLYFHSGRHDSTFRIWRFLGAQFDTLVAFLLSEDGSQPSPLPILDTTQNRHRHDPWDAIALHNIYRDPWERKVPTMKPQERDVRSTHDYPELEEMFDELDGAAAADPNGGGDCEKDAEEVPGMPKRRTRDDDEEAASHVSSPKRPRVSDESSKKEARPTDVNQDSMGYHTSGPPRSRSPTALSLCPTPPSLDDWGPESVPDARQNTIGEGAVKERIAILGHQDSDIRTGTKSSDSEKQDEEDPGVRFEARGDTFADRQAGPKSTGDEETPAELVRENELPIVCQARDGKVEAAKP